MHGLSGLRTDDGSLLWPAEALFDKAVARDRSGGVVFLDAGDLWWFASGASEPALVALAVPTRLVEVIGFGDEAVVRLGYGEWVHVRLRDGAETHDPGGGVVSLDSEGRELWSAQNGWSVSVQGPALVATDEGPPTGVESPARLVVTDASGAVVVDAAVGTEGE
ncbi:MAG TPA: hypothetical protein VMM81_02270, partial [Acidimicrobiia bacterium]|nr:hypothetical protein [Acidimicrobiia bacterium]